MVTNVREIVAEWLKAHGFDGLCSEECGCGIDDLMPCDESNSGECVPGHFLRCPIVNGKPKCGDAGVIGGYYSEDKVDYPCEICPL